MSSELDKLIDRAKDYRMTPDEREAQRRSFAYGNVRLHNDDITQQMIDQAAEDAIQAANDGIIPAAFRFKR